MPGVERFSITELVAEASEIRAAGVGAVILFGIPAAKDEVGSGAYDDEGVVQMAVRALKEAHPELVVITDVCLCEYTSHGHCGFVRDGDGGQRHHGRAARQDGDLPRGGRSRRGRAQRHDGRAGRAIRHAARRGGPSRRRRSWPTRPSTPRAFYGPFREAADSTPEFGDRRGYQMDPRQRARGRCARSRSTSRRAPTWSW